MQKYLTQHSFKAFTIQLPRNFVMENQTTVLMDEESLGSAERVLLNRFTEFIQKNTENGIENLPVFNFLTVFYDVRIEAETNEFVEFKLNLNEALNESMWLRFKHTIFNQYNALIGFSEVLKEVEELDDNDRMIINRINKNAREMFKSTKLLMEYEQLRDYNYELKMRLARPYDYLSSYMLHSQNKEEYAAIELNPEAIENISINIDHEFFKESLDLFFEAFNETVDLSNSKFQIKVEQFCQLRFEFSREAVKETDLFHEVQSINDFFEKGINMMHFSDRMFHLLFIRLIAEKLGGSFTIAANLSTNQSFLAEWTFPYIKSEFSVDEFPVSHSPIETAPKIPMIPKVAEIYPEELRNEIANYFSIVNDTFVLDEWKTFADKLDIICVKYKVNGDGALKQITKRIRQAVDSFDVMALRKLREKLKQISFTK